MTAVADLLSRADRDRLAARLAELRQLDALVRERGGMPAVPEPPALHKMAAARDNDHDTDDTATTGERQP